MKKHRKDPLDDFMSRYGHMISKPDKKVVPVKKLNLETIRLKIGDTVIETASGLIAKVIELDEWKGIGFIATNRDTDIPENSRLKMYEDQAGFEDRLSSGRLILL